MEILLIGNGFDLAHGLATEYGSFLKFLKLVSVYDVNQKAHYSGLDQYQFCIHYVDEMFTKENNETRDLLIRTATKNKWIMRFQSVFSAREQKEKTGWIDFESEISSIIQILDRMRRTINDETIFHDKEVEVDTDLWKSVAPFIDNTILCKKTRLGYFSLDQIDEIENYLVSDLNDLTRCLEIYLADFIEQQNVLIRLPDIQEIHPQKVLSFNYTNTCEKYYFPASSSIQYDYIHGKADIAHTVDTCNMVLGIDEYLQGNERDRIEFIRFKKYYQRIYKRTGCNYRDWIAKMKSNCEIYAKSKHQNKLYIFGHSLDMTDADVLYSLIMSPFMVTTIFYHNLKAYSQQIANLVRIIGQDNLTEMVHGAHPRIIFRQQRDAV